jgi:hypothetical protein
MTRCRSKIRAPGPDRFTRITRESRRRKLEKVVAVGLILRAAAYVPPGEIVTDVVMEVMAVVPASLTLSELPSGQYRR